MSGIKGDHDVEVTFHGVRGSTPCACEANAKVGGNTACVSVRAPGHDPVVFDLGTGLRFFGDDLFADPAYSGPLRATAFVSHLHWDHVQGLPFFEPIHVPGAELTVYAPAPEKMSLEAAFNEFMRPPYFPVGPADLIGDITFVEFDEGQVGLGEMLITARHVPHVGVTNGYRLEVAGVSVVYISDHQEPLDRSMRIDDAVLELCDGADVLIHDAQYTRPEWNERAHWGHCTEEFAMKVAAESGVRLLALFHHDPAHNDQVVDAIEQRCQLEADRLGLPGVVAARENMKIFLASTPEASSRVQHALV